MALALVVDAELFRLDAVVRWLDAADGRLKRAAVDAAPPAPLPPRLPRLAPATAGGAGDDACCELRQVSKVYGEGADRGARAARRRPVGRARASWWRSWARAGRARARLLTIAGSLEEPTSGEVLVGGAALSGMSRNDRARLRRRSIGFVFQDFNLLAGLTAAENVAMPLELDGIARQDGPRGRRWRRSRSSAWPSGPTASPTSCPAASASGWPSPGPWSATAACCWPTSRPARSTRSTARR